MTEENLAWSELQYISIFAKNNIMETEVKQNIMGYDPIPKLIMKLSLPLMLSMLIQALYNVVDSIFVARVSEASLTAVSLAYPLQNLMIAFGIGTAVGVNSYLARKLGEKKHNEAEMAANNGIFLAIITWLAFALFGIFGTRPFLSLFTDDPELLKLSVDYAGICLIFSFGIFIDITAERIMQATGDSIHPMITQSMGAITNIILDPVFIFVFDMGVSGAAIATVLGQIVSMLHRDGKRAQFDSHRILRNSCIRPRCLFQAPVIHLHACFRSPDRYDSNHCIQLWSEEEGKNAEDTEGWTYHSGVRNDHRLPHLPATS